MRLSEAILLGSTSVKSTPGTLLETYPDGGTYGCALGMACFAESVAVPFDSWTGLGPVYENWRWLYDRHQIPCGCTRFGGEDMPAAVVIAHMFDYHVSGKLAPNWTLEQLVDWVRSVEPSEPNHEDAASTLGRAPVEPSQELCTQAKKG